MRRKDSRKTSEESFRIYRNVSSAAEHLDSSKTSDNYSRLQCSADANVRKETKRDSKNQFYEERINILDLRLSSCERNSRKICVGGDIKELLVLRR